MRIAVSGDPSRVLHALGFPCRKHYSLLCPSAFANHGDISGEIIPGTHCRSLRVLFFSVRIWVAREVSALAAEACIHGLLRLNEAVFAAVGTRLGFLWYSVQGVFHSAAPRGT